MMISKRPQPVIEKLAGTWCSGGNLGSTISPRSPLEIMSIQSPKSPKKYDFVGGVGLGIVAALERSEHAYVSHHRITRNESRSNHVPVEMEKNDEDYNFVTCHEPKKNNTTSTKVDFDDGVDQYRDVTRKRNIGSDTKNLKKNGPVIFEISPARYSDDDEDFPVTDFLDFCHLCRRTLHGKDIYMYRGDKAFCSKECRYVEIGKDESKEKQKSRSKLDASRSTNTNTTNPVSTTSPHTSDRVNFANGIIAT